jgi:hypothetical protein
MRIYGCVNSWKFLSLLVFQLHPGYPLGCKLYQDIPQSIDTSLTTLPCLTP